MPYKLFKTSALRSNIHVCVTYVITPSQVFLIIIWDLTIMHYLSWEVRLRWESRLERGRWLSSNQWRNWFLNAAFSAFTSVPGAKHQAALSMSQSLGFSLVFSLQKRDEDCDFPHSLIGKVPDALLQETKHNLCFKRGSIFRGRFDQVYKPTVISVWLCKCHVMV